MTTGRSKWQTSSRATIFFMLSLLTICLVRLLFDPSLLLADEFSVNTAEQPPDFAGMKLKAGVELNQELDKCHKLKPEECEKCKEEAGKRWRLEIERIHKLSSDWSRRRKAKTAPTSGQQPTPQPQPTPSTKPTAQPKPSTKQPTQPTPQAKQPTQPKPQTKQPTQPAPQAKQPVNPTPQTKQPNEPTDFDGMRLRARVELKQKLEECQKSKWPTNCEDCKREANKRFYLDIEWIEDMSKAKTAPTSGQKPTPQPQPKPSTKPTAQPKPSAKPTPQPTQPKPSTEQPTKPADFAKKRLEAKAELNEELDKCHKLKPEECEKCKQEANKRYNLKIKQIENMNKAKTAPTSGQKPTPQPQPKPKAKQPTQPQPQAKQPAKPTPAPSKPPRYEKIENLDEPVPCVDLSESPYLVDMVLAKLDEHSFNCHFYTKTYLRTIKIANNGLLFPNGNPKGNRDECLTKEDLAKVGFQPVDISRGPARVGDILMVEGPHAWPCPHQHSAVVTEVDESGRILKLRQKDDPDHCVYDTTLEQFITVYVNRPEMKARLYSPRQGGGNIP